MTVNFIFPIVRTNFVCVRTQLCNFREQPESSKHTAAISPEQAMEAIEETEENGTDNSAAALDGEQASTDKQLDSA
jgi:2-iminoacetate synthase ThiH